MATSAAAAVAAMAARARREVREYFEQRGALDSNHAVSFEPPTKLHRRQFEYLVGTGIVKQTADGRYWFDQASYRQEQDRKAEAAKRMMIVLLIALVVGIGVAAIVARIH